MEEHANKNFDWQYLQNYLHYIQRGKSKHVQHLRVHEMLSFVMGYFSIPFHKYPGILLDI